MKLPISVTLRQRGGVQGPSPAPRGDSSKFLRRWKACLPWRPRNVVPERPRLAPGVELCGELAESGFAQQQWLAQRDGRFIQLTELLYRVAEQANGEHTVREIAAAVSAAMSKRVTDGNVRRLIRRKLIPGGIVQPAEGTGRAAGEAEFPAAASPLAVNLKMAMVGPRLID